jgi:hypothetical protein
MATAITKCSAGWSTASNLDLVYAVTSSRFQDRRIASAATSEFLTVAGVLARGAAQ